MKEVETLRAVVGNYEKDKTALGQSKARLLQSDKHLKHLEWENEVCLALWDAWEGKKQCLHCREIPNTLNLPKVQIPMCIVGTVNTYASPC